MCERIGKGGTVVDRRHTGGSKGVAREDGAVGSGGSGVRLFSRGGGCRIGSITQGVVV